MKKLQNIKAIKQMLSGTHRRQSNKSTSLYNLTSPQTVSRKVGEVWTDENGETWEQREGFAMKQDKLEEIRAYILSNRLPSSCPKCKEPMTKRLDEKFWKLEKQCFDCHIQMEHELKIAGKYEEYEKDRIAGNVQSWLIQAESEVQDLAKLFRDPLTFSSIDGVEEKWQGNTLELADRIEEDFKTLKNNLLSK